MLPTRLLAVCASAAVAVTACGRAGEPTFAPAVADDLATRADELAAALEAGDACAALETAGGLVTVASAERDEGRVPASVAAAVIDTTRDTVRDLECAPPGTETEPAPSADDDDSDDDRDEGEGRTRPKGKDKGKAKGRGNGGGG